MNKVQKSLRDFAEALYKVKIQPEDVDYRIAEAYIPFFKTIDSLNASAVIVLDYFRHNYFYVSDDFNEKIGFHAHSIFSNKHEDLRKRFHPEDFIINVGAVKARSFIYEQPIEYRKDYRYTQEVRILNDSNVYVRCIIQSTNIELDAKGHFWLNMCLCDLAPDQDLETPGSACLWNTKNGDVIFSMKGKKIIGQGVSERETEILSLIAQGKRSKEISDELFISINTVSNHRKNIMKKLDVTNSSEAVQSALKLGII